MDIIYIKHVNEFHRTPVNIIIYLIVLVFCIFSIVYSVFILQCLNNIMYQFYYIMTHKLIFLCAIVHFTIFLEIQRRMIDSFAYKTSERIVRYFLFTL